MDFSGILALRIVSDCLDWLLFRDFGSSSFFSVHMDEICHSMLIHLIFLIVWITLFSINFYSLSSLFCLVLCDIILVSRIISLGGFGFAVSDRVVVLGFGIFCGRLWNMHHLVEYPRVEDPLLGVDLNS